MSFATGFYDFVAHVLPGSLYLAVALLVAERWTDAEVLEMLGSNGGVGVATVVLATAFLTGQATYDVGRFIDRFAPGYPGFSAAQISEAREDVRRLTPQGARNDLLVEDPSVLYTYLQRHHAEMAVDILRMRASSVLMRSSTFPIMLMAILGVIISIEEASIPTGVAAVFLVAFAVVTLQRSRTLSRWSMLRLFESVIWVESEPRKAAKIAGD